eukprot:2156670-Pleurochrysis_carterae.AAC.2
MGHCTLWLRPACSGASIHIISRLQCATLMADHEYEGFSQLSQMDVELNWSSTGSYVHSTETPLAPESVSCDCDAHHSRARSFLSSLSPPNGRCSRTSWRRRCACAKSAPCDEPAPYTTGNGYIELRTRTRRVEWPFCDKVGEGTTLRSRSSGQTLSLSFRRKCCPMTRLLTGPARRPRSAVPRF